MLRGSTSAYRHSLGNSPTSCDRGLEPAGAVHVFPPVAKLRRLARCGRAQSTQFLDYQVVNSDIEAERDHLRVGDHIVRC